MYDMERSGSEKDATHHHSFLDIDLGCLYLVGVLSEEVLLEVLQEE